MNLRHLRTHFGITTLFKFLMVIPLTLVLPSCVGDGSSPPSGGGGGGTTPVIPPTTPGTAGSTVIGLPGFCEVGDAATLVPESDGRIRFSLPPEGFQDPTDCTVVDDRDSKNDEYLFVVTNLNSSALSLQIDEPDSATAPRLSVNTGNNGQIGRQLAPQDMEEAFRLGVQSKGLNEDVAYSTELLRKGHKVGPGDGGKRFGANAHFDASLSTGGGGGGLIDGGSAVGDEVVFNVPSEVDVVNECRDTSAILKVQTTNARIYIDRDLASLFDDGDATVDCSAATVTNRTLCIGALTRIGAVFENNILPMMTNLAGDVPDVNGDDTVSILITPRINSIPFTDGNSRDFPAIVPSFGYSQTTDFLAFDPTTNPCSNEQEVIYIHSADPLGVHNSLDPVDVDEYVRADLMTAITYQLQQLINYNMHVLVGGGSPEEQWLNDTLSWAFVWLSGFGNEATRLMFQIYAYLDQPSYVSLFNTDRWHMRLAEGMKAIFGKFILDSQVDTTVVEDANGFDTDLAFLQDLYGTEIGIENLTTNLTFTFDPDEDTLFTALFKFFGIAMAVSNTAAEKVGTTFPYLLPTNTTLFGSGIADAGGSTRAGADGGVLDTDAAQNVFGFEINGYNAASGYLFENADFFTYAPGNDFFAHADSFAFNFIRFGGLVETISNFLVSFDTSSALGFIVRRADIDQDHPIVYSESIEGTLDDQRETICTAALCQAGGRPIGVDYLNTIGSARGEVLTIVGELDDPSFVPVYNRDSGVVTDTEVPDHDIYNITMPALATDSDKIAFWVEQQQMDTGGTSSMQPILAVVSSDDVPDLTQLTQNALPEWRYVVDYVDTVNNDTLDQEDTSDTGMCAFVDNSSPAPAHNLLSISNQLRWATIIDDIFFDQFVLIPDPSTPEYDISEDPPVFFQPRPKNVLEAECPLGGGTFGVDIDSEGDNLIGDDELIRPANFQQQILHYMARESAVCVPGPTEVRNCTASEDTLAVDDDSEDDDDPEIVTVDYGNKIGGYGVKEKETAVLMACSDNVNTHIVLDMPVADDPAGYGGYQGSVGFNQPAIPNDDRCVAGTGQLYLTAGETYSVIVMGVGSVPGRYELKIRKWDKSTDRVGGMLVDFP